MFKIKGRYNVPPSFHVDNAYRPAYGCFALANKTKSGADKNSVWHSCRENFAKIWQISPVIMFSDGSKQREKIAQFIALAEEKLGLKEFSQVTGFENREWQVLIEPTAWWTTSELRRQFFTALLRASRYYKNDSLIPWDNGKHIEDKKDEFSTTLYSTMYFALTKKATKMFFDGYTTVDSTVIMAGNHGWYYYFRDELKDAYTKFLKKE